ncbi:MAG: hypothetical protein ABGX16_06875 [Pirellulales bacterium]
MSRLLPSSGNLRHHLDGAVAGSPVPGSPGRLLARNASQRTDGTAAIPAEVEITSAN